MANSDEFFDVVDANDRVIGRELRRDVHARHLWHRAIHVLVFDVEGKIFLQKRSLTKDSAPGLWASSCSGHVDSGEDYDTAARRELAEEIGVALSKPPPRWFRIDACAATGWEFVWVYRLEYSGPLVLNPDEIERGAWFARAELEAQIRSFPENFAESFRLVWKRAQAMPE